MNLVDTNVVVSCLYDYFVDGNNRGELIDKAQVDAFPKDY
jgi:hypothetical protein